MPNNRLTRFLPQLGIAALAMPLFAGWSSAAPIATNNANHTSSAPAFAVSGSRNQTLNASIREAFLAGSSQNYQVQTFQPVTGTQGTFANPAFQRTWERTDKPVASGQTQRSWFWGPTPGVSVQEDYAEGQGGKRLVQYFDKSRMEINNPAGNANDPFFVTNGLLTVELISGKMQTGNSTYVDRYPADIPLASDSDDTNAPTYLSFSAVSNTPLGDHPATSRLSQNVTATIARDGTVGDDQTKATYPKDNVIYFEQTTKHNIPLAIWEFLNQTGPVYDSTSGQTKDGQRLSDPWFYATGYPISEAYWARVKIAGQMQDVLIQAFQRRVVTYVPNGVPGFKVQMGNIGQHYYDWRYNNLGKPQATPTPASTAVPPTATKPAGTAVPPTATKVSDPNADCSGIPAQINMIVSPECGPGGTTFSFTGTGFQPGETASVYLTLPNQAVYAAPFQTTADPSGRIVGVGLRSDRSFPAGIWGITMESITSHYKAIGRFKITSPPTTPTRVPGTAAPTAPAASCDTSSSRDGEARPNNGREGDTLQITARGFQPNEAVSYWFTTPDGDVYGTEEAVEGLVNPDGTIGPLDLDIDSFFASTPGIWGTTFQGDSSHHQAVIYFCVNP